MPMPSFDVVVIGAGVNGMAAALRLAKAGAKVTLLESARRLGGAMRSREFHPGFHAPAVAALLPGLDARLGLSVPVKPVESTALAENGAHLVTSGAFFETVAGLSAADATAWGELRGQLLNFARVLAPFKVLPPPKLTGLKGNNAAALLKNLLKVRMLGRAEFRELLRMVLINVADVLHDDLDDERLKALVAFDAVLGTHSGPQSPNSLLPLLYRLSNGPMGWPVGGMDAVVAAFETALAKAGVQAPTGAKAARITVENDAVAGVELADGEVVKTALVLSAINPKTTLLHLTGPEVWDTGMVRKARNIRQRGHVARLNLALSAAPDFQGAGLDRRLVIAPSVSHVERAWNAVKYGDNSTEPVMEILIPSAIEAGHSPNGQHVLTANVCFANDSLSSGGDWPEVMAVLERYAPGISGLVLKAELLMPSDLEGEYGISEWHHGELSVEQMLVNRPFHGVHRYETPLKGLYLGGAGSHPGGYVTGTAGVNAAEAMIGGRL